MSDGRLQPLVLHILALQSLRLQIRGINKRTDVLIEARHETGRVSALDAIFTAFLGERLLLLLLLRLIGSRVSGVDTALVAHHAAGFFAETQTDALVGEGAGEVCGFFQPLEVFGEDDVEFVG